MFTPQYPEFDSIILLKSERFILFSLRFKRRQCGDVYSPRLIKLREYGLIIQNHLPQCDNSGNYLSDGTFSISDRGKRFCAYASKERFKRYITPAIVAFFTTIITNALEPKILSALLNWIKDLF